MPHILLIDDDGLMRDLVRATLEEAGYIVIQARNGREGLALYRAAPPDLVLTDLVMPEQDGIGVIIALRKEFPAVKIVAMSGGGRGSAADYLKSARLLGAVGTLPKPFTHEALLAAIEAALASPGPSP
jgi:two-component system, chemotaxis family, chemotaxis protein CheY